jgi:hypothetical protein
MNLDSLKKEFDLVKIKHYNIVPTEENPHVSPYRATHVALVKGLNVYIGIARCFEEDPFNRKIGREIALGRAYHEYLVHTKQIGNRGFKKWSYVKFAEDADQVEDILAVEVFSGPIKDPMAVPEAEEGQCAGCHDCHCAGAQPNFKE